MEIDTHSSISPLSLMAHGFLMLLLVPPEGAVLLLQPIHNPNSSSCHSLLTSSVWAQSLKYGDYADKKNPGVRRVYTSNEIWNFQLLRPLRGGKTVCFRALNYGHIEMLISISLSAYMENLLVLHVGDIIQNFRTQEESWKLEKQIMKPFI